MKTGSLGTFVISWNQTEVDGLTPAPSEAVNVGATWRWTGETVRVDGPGAPLVLEGADEIEELHRRAARSVRRIVGAALRPANAPIIMDLHEPLLEEGFVVTDGRRSYSLTVIEVGPGSASLIMFLGAVPPADTDLWVVQITSNHPSLRNAAAPSGGVICFTPGTRISTPDGQRFVEELQEGDRIQTKDDGVQEIRWVGSRRMSGARLFAMPSLRPIRLKAGALGNGEPDGDLVVSPEHRVLIRGGSAEALFNTPEVLVAAKDLINDRTILPDHSAREVTYIHLLLDRHQIVWANGVETESFHPANAELDTVDEAQRRLLFERFPDLRLDAQSFGDYARRNLSPSEAALLRYKGGSLR